MREKKFAINLPADVFADCPSCRNPDYLHELSFDVWLDGGNKSTHQALHHEEASIV